MKKILKAFSSQILLPVILLLSFNLIQAQVDYKEPLVASEEGVGFHLKWTTSNDRNADFFVVERSRDGKGFTPIGTVMSKQSSDLTEYAFKDLELGLKKVQYRLKEVNKDGSSSLSEAIAVTKEFISNFEVVSKEKMTEEIMEITINSVVDVELECRVTDNMGNVMIEELRKIEIGLNDIVFDLTSEPEGTYHMIFKQDNVIETVAFKKEMKDKKANTAKKKSTKSGG